MKPYGDIKIPLETTELIPLTCNQDAIDFMLDCAWNGQFTDMIHICGNTDLVSYLIHTNVYSSHYNKWFDAYLMVIVNPPPFLRKFKDQKFVIVASNLLMNMQRYWIAHKALCKTTEQFNFIKYLVAIIDTHIENNRKNFKLF